MEWMEIAKALLCSCVAVVLIGLFSELLILLLEFCHVENVVEETRIHRANS